MLIYKKKKKKIGNYQNYLKESVRIFIIIFYFLIAYSSQSKRRNFINEVIEEEDEDKNKEKNKNGNNTDKYNKNMNKNNKQNENIYSDERKHKPVLIWSNSHFNKKTYENLFYKQTFDKYVPIREQLINNENTNTNGVVPDHNNKNNNLDKNSNTKEIKTSIVSKNNLRSKSMDKTNPQSQQNKNKNNNIDNNINNNINNINSTNDTSAFTHSSKKYFTPRAIYTQNYTEDLSKFRMGLLSAGSSCNNNVIIPIMPFRRPVSNFNFGAGNLLNNFENSNFNKKEKQEEKNEEKEKDKMNKEKNNEINKKEINTDITNLKRNYNIYNKVNSATRNNKPFIHSELKKRLELFQSKNDINNLYIGMDKMITKLHKIKIEKGMMNSGIVNSLNKKFNRDYQNQIEQFKKSHLPMMFDNQSNKIINPNDKNKLRSHSFNNKNNFY